MKDKRKYRETQMHKIEEIVVETGKLLPAYRMAYQSGDVDIFVSFIKENKLQEAFVENSFEDFIELDSDEKQCFIKIAEELGLQYLREIYGEELYEKIENLYKAKRFKFIDIYELSVVNRKGDVKQQANIIGKLLDLYNDKNLTIGLHRTKGWINSGDIINEQGLNLTGHSSYGADCSNYVDIKSKLEKNISFEEHPGLFIREIATGGGYRNGAGIRFVDISIIAIPNKEFERKDQNISIGDAYSQQMLNPEFVRGYVTVDAKDATLLQYVENPKYITRNKVEQWIKKFKDWEEASKQPRFYRTKMRLRSIFQEVLPENMAIENGPKMIPKDKWKRNEQSR